MALYLLDIGKLLLLIVVRFFLRRGIGNLTEVNKQIGMGSLTIKELCQFMCDYSLETFSSVTSIL